MVISRPPAHQLGVGQVDFGLRQVGFGLRDLRLPLLHGVFGGLDVLLHQVGDLHLRLGAGDRRLGGLHLRGGLIDVGLRRRPRVDRMLATVIALRLCLVRLRLLQLRLRLLQRGRNANAGDLEIDLGAGKLRARQRQVGTGLVARVV